MKFGLIIASLCLAFGTSESTVIPQCAPCIKPVANVQCTTCIPTQNIQTFQTIQPVVSNIKNIPFNGVNTINTNYAINTGYTGAATNFNPSFRTGYVAAPYSNIGVSSPLIGTQSFTNNNQFALNDIDKFRGSLIGYAGNQRMALQNAQNDASNSAIIMGSGNVAAGNGHLIGGNQNSVYGLDISVLGNGNAIKGASSTIIGNENSLLKGK